ncbi:hypothetical protein BBJ28_00012434 [Nothophytophthora sp. Chile5]|nr:hypothetical protein BBJ28_00012434 [Nothophytophthora sp. Chile5]
MAECVNERGEIYGWKHLSEEKQQVKEEEKARGGPGEGSTWAAWTRAQAAHVAVYRIFPSGILQQELEGHHLTELWLTNHHLNHLPPEIAVFAKLRVLGLAGNALTALPDGLAELNALEALYLERNKLQTLPVTVAFPPQLRDLRLDSNQLSVFPMQITKLRLLNRLGLSHNQLKSLPTQIQRLRNLMELDLDYNRLDDLPKGFAALQSLERLGLEGNCLAMRPSVLDRLPALTYVRLSGNRSAGFLSTTDGVGSGSANQLVAVPRRQDGYFQCMEGYRVLKGDKGEAASDREQQERRVLKGLVPCRDQNLLNVETYRTYQGC